MGQGRQGSGCKSKRVKMKSIEEKLAANQLDRLAKHWSGMKGKRIQPTDAIKLSAMVAKFGKDELEQLAAKDIPFLSMAAINNLMIKHNYNAAKIKGLMKEDTELLYDLYMFEDVDAGEYDYEGDMAKTQLVTISDAAEELHDMLEDDENIPEWCQNKITKAMDYLDSVRDYMLAKDTGEEPGDENPNEEYELDEKKGDLHLYNNEADARKKAKEVSGKVIKGTGKSTGKWAVKEEFEPKTAGMKITHKKPHPAGGHYVVLSKPGAGQHVIRHLNKGKVKTLGTVASLGLAKSYIDAKAKGKDPKDLIKKENYKVGDTVKPTKGPHAGHPHEVIHDHGDGHYNIAPIGLAPKSIKYGLGAAKAHKKDLRKESLNMDEGILKPLNKDIKEAATSAMKKAGTELSAYAKKSGGIDKAAFLKAAEMLSSAQAGMSFIKFVKDQDTEVFEKIITVMSKHMGKQTVEKMFKVRIREDLAAKVRKEEVEQLDELSPRTKASYYKKAKDQNKSTQKAYDKSVKSSPDKFFGQDDPKDQARAKTMDKRQKGMAMVKGRKYGQKYEDTNRSKFADGSPLNKGMKEETDLTEMKDHGRFVFDMKSKEHMNAAKKDLKAAGLSGRNRPMHSGEEHALHVKGSAKAIHKVMKKHTNNMHHSNMGSHHDMNDDTYGHRLTNESVQVDEILDTPKAMQSYKNKAKASYSKAASSAAAKILRGKDKDGNRADHRPELKTMAKRKKGMTGADMVAVRRTFDNLRKEDNEATNPLQKRADANKKAIDTGFMKLSKSDYEKEKKRLSGEGAMKRIATTQSNKADRIGSGGSKGLNTFKKKPAKVDEKAPKVDPNKYAAHMAKNKKPKKMSSTQTSLAGIRKKIGEKLEVSDGMGAWIDDFKQSDAPQFKGKNAKERRDMAIAAYLSAKKDSE